MAERRMLYLQYANPGAYPPLVASSRMLADAGWDIYFLGAHSEGPERLTLPPHGRIRSEIVPYTPRGWRQKWAYLRFIVRAWGIARRWRARWIYVSDPMAAPAGVLLSLGRRYRIVYHEHDGPIGSGAASWFIRLVLAARRRLARVADLNIVPQRERIALFAQETSSQRPIACVWNCPLRSDAEPAELRLREAHEPLGVYFHGSVNLDRVPLALVEGAARCGIPVSIRIVGYETVGSKGTIERLRAAAAASGVSIEFPGAVPRHDLRRLMAGMHVGWMNFIHDPHDVNLRHLAGASNKAFDYLAAGLPMIVPEAPEWERMFVAPGFARPCDAADPAAIAEVLRWFYDHPGESAEMGRRGRENVLAEWNYEKQFAQVRDVLESVSDPTSTDEARARRENAHV